MQQLSHKCERRPRRRSRTGCARAAEVTGLMVSCGIGGLIGGAASVGSLHLAYADLARLINVIGGGGISVVRHRCLACATGREPRVRAGAVVQIALRPGVEHAELGSVWLQGWSIRWCILLPRLSVLGARYLLVQSGAGSIAAEGDDVVGGLRLAGWSAPSVHFAPVPVWRIYGSGFAARGGLAIPASGTGAISASTIGRGRLPDHQTCHSVRENRLVLRQGRAGSLPGGAGRVGLSADGTGAC